MSDDKSRPSNPAELRERALSRWDNEGGAGPDGPQEAPIGAPDAPAAPLLGNAELVQLQVRVIALENLMLALLSEAAEQQIELVHEMAACISPRPGFTAHPLTLHAAAQMIHLVRRAGHFRGLRPIAPSIRNPLQPGSDGGLSDHATG